MSPPLVIFDLDGTLLDTAPDLVAALNASIAPWGLPPVAISTVRHHVGHGARALVELALANAGREAEPAAIATMVERFLAVYEDRIAVETRPFPGATSALNRLADRGFRLAICTNKRELLARKVLAEVGLAHLFAAIAGGDTFPAKKPDGRHLLDTIAAAGCDRASSLMVGDSRNDVDAARDAGLPVIAFSHGYTDEPVERLAPDLVIDRFDQLEAAVDRLLGPARDS